jgi:hypothetical protein
MLKRHMTPLGKGGALHAHKGKGSQMAGMPDRRMVSQLTSPNSQFNDYAKATPMPQGVGSDGPDMPLPAPPGLGG